MTEKRPNPDVLLGKIKRKEEKKRRGQLKIFFGSCSGVGKTYSMLSAARTLQAQNIDIIIGLIETHGRIETAELVKGLNILPPKIIEYRGKSFKEFDLDAALTRRPSLILIDELAHSNIKGSRHTKRWQDVEELLTAGIDVYTTVNVQHLESLNDVVGHITGIRVFETFPDRVFDNADEVILVDLPPDELLIRLKEGKVYLPEQTQHAIQNFFRKGNLIALRELALRRMADRVDEQMREYRADQSIQRVWQAKERIIVCVGPHENTDKLIRKAYRLSAHLRADWHALYVETPTLQKLSKNKRDQIIKNLKFAQELGAETHILSGTDLTEAVIQYAYSHNISKILVGKPRRSKLSRLFSPSLPEKLTNQTDIDVYIVEHQQEVEEPEPRFTAVVTSLEFQTIAKPNWHGYFWAIIFSALISFLGITTHYLNLTNIALLYLLSIVLIAAYYGHRPSIFASLLNVAAFDFFFVLPQLSFSVKDTQYVITCLMMLVVALIICNITANLRYQAHVAVYRERRTNAIYALNKELLASLTIQQIAEISSRHLSSVFQAKVSLLLPDNHNKVHSLTSGIDPTVVLPTYDSGIAQWVFDNQQPAGLGTQTLPASPILYLPLRAPMRIRGVLAIIPTHSEQLFLPEQQRLLDTFAAQIALSIEHLHYVEVARDALLSMESERLRNALLDTISEDLYTPLTSILSLANNLATDQTLAEKAQHELAQKIYERTMRMRNLVTNLIDMARLQAGGLELNKQWCKLIEIINKALQSCQTLLTQHKILVSVPEELPLIQCDPVLIKRLFCHLLENVSKHTPPGTLVEITAEHKDNKIFVYVEDNGPGFPKGMEEKIFEKFTRGPTNQNISGVGLGLAISRAIIAVHGGKIYAENRIQGGRFTIIFPIHTPSPIP